MIDDPVASCPSKLRVVMSVDRVTFADNAPGAKLLRGTTSARPIAPDGGVLPLARLKLGPPQSSAHSLNSSSQFGTVHRLLHCELSSQHHDNRHNQSQCLTPSSQPPTPLSSSPMTVSISLCERPDRVAHTITNECQSDKLQSLIKAAKIEDVEPIWTTLFAKVRTST